MATVLYNQTNISGAYNRSNVWVANAYRFRVEVLLNSQDLINNKSNVTVNFYIQGLNNFRYEGFSNTTAILQKTASDADYVTVASGTYNSMARSGVEYLMLSYTGDIIHATDGTMSVNYECTYSGSSGTNFRPRPQDMLTGTLSLPTILRESTIAVTPSLLQQGGTMDIAITRYVNSYTMTVTYEVNGNTVTLGTKSSTLSYSVPYSTIAGYLGTYTSGSVVVTCTTYSGNTVIGTVTQTIMVQTGVVPMSLYDDMQGSVGATLGQEAQGSGFNCYLDAQFSFDGLTLNGVLSDYVIEDGTDGDWHYVKYASGRSECWLNVEHVANSWSQWTGSFYYNTSFSTPAYPTNLFIAVPAVTTGLQKKTSDGNGLKFLATSTVASNTSYGSIRIIGLNQKTETFYITIHAIGRWK